MAERPKILAAASVREKQKKWQQINITAFAKKKKAFLTLEAEKCCDTYHQNDLRRDGTEVRKHPKRVLRIFIFYSVYQNHIQYDDELGAGTLLHDTREDVSNNIGVNIEQKYGEVSSGYVDAVSRRKGESVKRYYGRVFRTGATIFMKACDLMDNSLGMLDEYYQDLPSADLKRLKRFIKTKLFSFLVIVEELELSGSRYEMAIRGIAEDLKLVCQEAQDAIALTNKDQKK